jgi:hypothetical protein
MMQQVQRNGGRESFTETIFPGWNEAPPRKVHDLLAVALPCGLAKVGRRHNRYNR